MRVVPLPNNISQETYIIYPDEEQHPGTGFNGHITYDLFGRRPEHRNILIVRDAALTFFSLTEDQIQKYQNLKEKLLAGARESGHTVANKQFVVDIYNKPQAYPGFSAAIYRFGAIPIFKTDIKLEVVYQDKILEVYIALCPGFSGFDTKRLESFVPSGKIETNTSFIQSLKINTPLYFHKYFEDIAGQLWSIRTQLPLEQAPRRTSAIENILASSVKPKISAMETIKGDPVAQEQAELGYYTRIFLLFLVNELFDLMGIDTIDSYKEKLQASRQDSIKYKLAKYIKSLFDAYDKKTDLPNPPASAPDWLKEYHTFTGFLKNVKTVSTSALPEQAKIVIPIYGDSTTAQQLMDRLVQEINNASDLYLLDYNEASAIYSIWYSSSIFLILTEIPDDLNGLLQRIESLNKGVSYFMEKGIDYSKTLPNVKEDAIQFFEHNKVDDLDLVRILENVKKKQIKTLITGWLNLLDRRVAKCICLLNLKSYQEKFKPLSKSQWLGLDHSVTNSLIKSALNQSYRRRLKSYQFISPHNGRYQGNIFQVINVLIPTLSDEKKKEVFLEVMNQFIYLGSK